jgi:hypothetical protein
MISCERTRSQLAKACLLLSRQPSLQIVVQLTTFLVYVRRRYGFLFSEKLPAELRALKAELKQAHEPGLQRRLQQRISKVQQALKQNEDRNLTDEVRMVSRWHMQCDYRRNLAADLNAVAMRTEALAFADFKLASPVHCCHHAQLTATGGLPLHCDPCCA